MSKKCIYRAREKEINEPCNASPCFQISPDVKLKEIPTTGEEYLLTVITERQKCATITRSKKDYSKFAKNQSCFVQELPYAPAPEKLKPTIEWQNIQVADFSDLRMYLSRMIMIHKSKIKCKKTLKRVNTYSIWETLFETTEPTLSSVIGMHRATIDKGFKALIQMLDKVPPGGTVSYQTGQWIYAFLACTRLPLLSETSSLLRSLARKCAEIRSHINEDDENAKEAVIPLNIFICLVARYFKQYDLAD